MKNNTLAIFDLDETLICGDSSSLWNEFLIEKEIAPKSLQDVEQSLMEDYYRGELNIYKYMEKTLHPLISLDTKKVDALLNEFISTKIIKIFYPDAINCIKKHKENGHKIIIISATGEHIVKKIAKYLDISESIGIQVETINHKFTGKILGTPSYKEGKVIRLKHWLENQRINYHNSVAYSDSANDIPLLNFAKHAVAVNPNQQLLKYSKSKNWLVKTWKL